jgi:hypothetical protein
MVSNNLSLDINSSRALVMNRKIKRLKWQPEEYAVLKEWVGKIGITEITKLVNDVSPVLRTVDSVQHSGNKAGYYFKVVK